jgi:protein phosphatase methylesterase 1
MQGKFQLVLLPAAGHAVHEDEDEAAKAADALAQFLRRFRVRPVLPLVAGPTL